jgi:hypothetical protein
MASTLLCPNCATPMFISRTLEPERGKPDAHVYHCRRCNISFMTEDHCPVAGLLTKH